MKLSIVYHSETGNTETMAALVAEGAGTIDGVEIKTMTVEEPDLAWLDESRAVIFGCPTYWGGMSWQMKRFFDTTGMKLNGKLAGFFATMNWPSGGGSEMTILTMTTAALVYGMLAYSGGFANGTPPVHFGAVAQKAVISDFDRDRAIKLGENMAKKGRELFG